MTSAYARSKPITKADEEGGRDDGEFLSKVISQQWTPHGYSNSRKILKPLTAIRIT